MKTLQKERPAGAVLIALSQADLALIIGGSEKAAGAAE